MIRTAVEADIPELMNIYNDAILHTTATFDTESKDMEERRAWFAEHTGRHILLVYERRGAWQDMRLCPVTVTGGRLMWRWSCLFISVSNTGGRGLAAG